jgi:hypothetical protein
MGTLHLKTTQKILHKKAKLPKTQNLVEFIIHSPFFQNQDIKLKRNISLTRKVSI